MWESNTFDVPPVSPPTDALGGDVLPKAPNSDTSPTVISRQPARTAHEEIIGSLRGRRLAHFELIAPIGVGGMAAVIKGRDLQLDRTVALKILPPEMATDPENVRRFHQEARAAAKLDHENVARVFYCGEDQRLHFIAFEFVQGDNLRTILDRRGRLPVPEALHYILQVAAGLAHAAGRGVVHRDIKPSNIIVSPNGRAKLVDMGLARTLTPQGERDLTQSGVTLGTFDYISPEQALEPRDADARSDIYSLGCTLYHMLTGQPPVPEGTAAKKLHHHQHERPIDPRQLNPDIPDEVAAVLSRMMAKNPRDRYQKPEHLVEHLLRIVQKLDAVSDRADGLLYVDAPLPTRPTRPLILVALAAAAVVALIFALEQPEGPPPSFPSARKPNPERNPDQGAAKDTRIEPPSAPGRDTSRDPLPGPGPVTHPFTWNSAESKPEDLLAFARGTREQSGAVELILDSDLILGGDNVEEGVALALRGKRITIRPGRNHPNPTIWIGQSDRGLTGLDLYADQVVLQDIRLVLHGNDAVPMTGVHIHGGREHRLENCQFFQFYPSYDESKPMESVVLESDGGRPELTVRECVFLGEQAGAMSTVSPGNLQVRDIGKGGQYGIVRRGPGLVTVTHCAFGPHTGCIRLEGPGRARQNEDLDIANCSALLSDSSAFLSLNETAATEVSVRYSLFSRPAATSSDGSFSLAAFIRQTGQPPAGSYSLQYHGKDNRFHNIGSYWIDPARDPSDPVTWIEFESIVKAQGGTDTQSKELLLSPWEDPEPLTRLEELRFARAFRVKTLPRDLRRTDSLLTRSQLDRLIGTEFCDRTNYTESLPEPDDGRSLAGNRREKIVDPSISASGNGQFKNLSQALDEAQPDDVIHIRHTGRLAVKPVISERAGLKVTIRPAEGYRPVLTLETFDRDAALFRLHQGEIRFVDLEFRIEPSQEGLIRSVAALVGDATCRFEGCTFTLAEAPQGCQSAAVVLSDPGTVMQRPTRPGEILMKPQIYFDRCVVRGEGDLVWCRASRAFGLNVSQTLAALSGSFLRVDGSRFAESQPAPTADRPGPRCELDLQRVTAATSGPLFDLQTTGEIRSILPIRFHASECLFLPLGSKKLLLLGGLNDKAGDMTLRERLNWESGRNAYGPYTGYIELQYPNRTDLMSPLPFNQQSWKDFTGEGDNSRFLDSFKLPETADASDLDSILPSHFRLPELPDFGANIDNLPKHLPEAR